MEEKLELLELCADREIKKLFEQLIFPLIQREAKKLSINKISELNNYYFFDINGKSHIDREFCELSEKHDEFFTWFADLMGGRYVYPENLNLKIK